MTARRRAADVARLSRDKRPCLPPQEAKLRKPCGEVKATPCESGSETTSIRKDGLGPNTALVLSLMENPVSQQSGPLLERGPERGQGKGDEMVYRWRVWAAAVLLAVAMIVAARAFPYFPGDPTAAQFVQAHTGESLQWAQFVTATAKAPWNLALVGGSILLSWCLVGRRAALPALISFLGPWLAGPWLSSWIARPRPSADLVRVVGAPSGYSAPSIFGLTYGAVFLFLGLIAYLHTKRRSKELVPAACGLMLLVGGCARIALGAHWPSDLLLSYLISYCWAVPLVKSLSTR